MSPFTSYGNYARRTMNSFDINELKKMNGEMEIVGEIGELVDLLKKYKIHNLTEESKTIIRKNLEIEIGDIVWYLTASLSSFYHFTFTDIGDFIVQKKPLQKKSIDEGSIEESAKRRDPEYLMEVEQNEIPISYLNQIINDDYCFDSEWKSLVQSACEIIYSNNREEVLEKSATLLLTLSKIAKMELGISMEKILSQNIEKLKQRYETGFDSNIASSRIQLLTDYKSSEPPKVYEKK